MLELIKIKQIECECQSLKAFAFRKVIITNFGHEKVIDTDGVYETVDDIIDNGDTSPRSQ